MTKNYSLKFLHKLKQSWSYFTIKKILYSTVLLKNIGNYVFKFDLLSFHNDEPCLVFGKEKIVVQFTLLRT